MPARSRAQPLAPTPGPDRWWESDRGIEEAFKAIDACARHIVRRRWLAPRAAEAAKSILGEQIAKGRPPRKLHGWITKLIRTEALRELAHSGRLITESSLTGSSPNRPGRPPSRFDLGTRPVVARRAAPYGHWRRRLDWFCRRNRPVLPARQQMVVVRVLRDGVQSYDELAAECGITRDGLRHLLDRLGKNLRRKIRKTRPRPPLSR